MREFNTRVAEGDYSITFETDDRKAYEQVQSLCRLLVDGKDGAAIPLEWVKNIINTNIYLWEQNKERMFVDQGVVKVVNYSITAQILSELIERWEKENGYI